MQKFLISAIIIFILFFSCENRKEHSPINEKSMDMEEIVLPLKIAFLPILDSLPFHIAAAKGYFDEQGVEVNGISVNSPLERDQLMQSGAIDGMLNELSSTALFNRENTRLKTVIIVRRAVAEGPVFRLLAAPQSSIKTPADLINVQIGVSKNSIIEYLTDRILQAEGLSPEEIITISVPVIPERFQLLMKGEIKAATLPDPLAQAAIKAGARLVIDDSSYPEYSLSALSFSIKTIETNSEAIRRFIKAWNKAVHDLNSDPDSFRDIFLENVPTPESVKETYKIPPFPGPMVPTEEQWNDVLNWLNEKGLLQTRPVFEEAITPEFL